MGLFSSMEAFRGGGGMERAGIKPSKFSMTGGTTQPVTKGLGKIGGPGMLLAMKGISALYAGFQAGERNKAIEAQQASLYQVWQKEVADAEKEKQLREEEIGMQFGTQKEALETGTGESIESAEKEIESLTRKRGFASTGTEIEGRNITEELMKGMRESKEKLIDSKDLALKKSEFQFNKERDRFSKTLAMGHARAEAGKKSFAEAAVGSIFG